VGSTLGARWLYGDQRLRSGGSVTIFKELGNDPNLLNDLSMKIRSQGPNCDLLNGTEAQEAMESGYWPGPYIHSPGM